MVANEKYVLTTVVCGGVVVIVGLTTKATSVVFVGADVTLVWVVGAGMDVEFAGIVAVVVIGTLLVLAVGAAIADVVFRRSSRTWYSGSTATILGENIVLSSVSKSTF